MAQAPNSNVDQNGHSEASHQGPQKTQDMNQPGPTERPDIDDLRDIKEDIKEELRMFFEKEDNRAVLADIMNMGKSTKGLPSEVEETSETTRKNDLEAIIGPQLEDYVEKLIRAETPINLPFIADLMGPEDGSKHQKFLNWLHRNGNAIDRTVHTHIALNSVVFSDILTYAIQYPEHLTSLLDQIIEDYDQLCQQWHQLEISIYHKGRDAVYHLMYGHYIKGLANPPRFVDVSLEQIVNRFCSDDEKKAWEQDSELLAEKSTSAKNVPDYRFKIKVIGSWLEKYPDMALAACALQVIQDEADKGQQGEVAMGSEVGVMEM
ncbi:hypothetical protein HII31_07141 [Pseudocercospora fuligena]|uniref:Uncharacterized protein n=1 Tax=Pseudocercospora fuligena TaxID=685502 RepID=A0A8H6VKQ7_9PEZI|nr:hypothetical protein HII31_07141 [Pseudocercospora fuligena]